MEVGVEKDTGVEMNYSNEAEFIEFLNEKIENATGSRLIKCRMAKDVMPAIINSLSKQIDHCNDEDEFSCIVDATMDLGLDVIGLAVSAMIKYGRNGEPLSEESLSEFIGIINGMVGDIMRRSNMAR